MTKEKLHNITLHFREGTSDKVYQAAIVQSGRGYVVNFAYGRKGKSLTTGTKTPSPINYDKAKDVYDKLIESKIAKGYRVNNKLDLPTPVKVKKKASKMYVCFTENNEWEGETWNFYLPVKGN